MTHDEARDFLKAARAVLKKTVHDKAVIAFRYTPSFSSKKRVHHMHVTEDALRVITVYQLGHWAAQNGMGSGVDSLALIVTKHHHDELHSFTPLDTAKCDSSTVST